jgi:hypothetical protein
MIVGDSFIQALQVDSRQNVGVKLEQLINQDEAGRQTEVLALGFPGFGPGLYLDIAVLAYPVRSLDPDEAVVVVQLGSDLDNSTVPADANIYFELDERGNAKVHPDNFKFWHDLAHYAITGFQPVDPVQLFRAHYLTPKLFDAVRRQVADQQLTPNEATASETAIPGFKGVVTEWGPSSGTHTVVNATTLVNTPGASNYLFESQPGSKAEEALAITKSLIKLAHDYAAVTGMKFYLVTVPAFPETFYQEYEGQAWQPTIGDYDLFGPDRALQDFAEKEGIPFLSLGQLMYDSSLSSAEIKAFYFLDGTGHLTPAGHQFLAEAIYSCFYAHQDTLLADEVGHSRLDTTACVN